MGDRVAKRERASSVSTTGFKVLQECVLDSPGSTLAGETRSDEKFSEMERKSEPSTNALFLDPMQRSRIFLPVFKVYCGRQSHMVHTHDAVACPRHPQMGAPEEIPGTANPVQADLYGMMRNEKCDIRQLQSGRLHILSRRLLVLRLKYPKTPWGA